MTTLPAVPNSNAPVGHTMPSVAPGQRRKDTRSMRRRSGQSAQVVRKGNVWHVRFYVDVPDERKRLRKSVPVGPAVGKEKLTKSEATRKASDIVRATGVNTAEHFERAVVPDPIKRLQHRVEWCRAIPQGVDGRQTRAHRHNGGPSDETHPASFRYVTRRSDHRDGRSESACSSQSWRDSVSRRLVCARSGMRE